MIILLKRTMQNALICRSAYTIPIYEDALKALHSLQSNAAYLKSVIKQSAPNDAHKLKDTEKYLIRSGITLDKLDTLSVIHVAGTKGKGSTCAFTEAILRKHGFSTGFFSSPHLVTVRERFRINGQPISQLHFAEYFWCVYKKLEDAKEYESDMPTYFKFLTILMFNIFLDCNINVAIIEVGIGGESDCTNIVRNPVCVGITSLGLDHISLLGNTIEEIACQKSGIFKSKTIAFTVPQPVPAMNVLEKRADEKNCKLRVAPPFVEYKWINVSPILGIRSNVQQQNASLAIQLANVWISQNDNKTSITSNGNINGLCKDQDIIDASLKCTKLSENVSMDKIALALSSCKWPGRTQILRSSVANFFLDGAHTVESIQCCTSWFKSMSKINGGAKYLIFNTTGDRNSTRLLMPLKSLNFEKVYFVPNFAGIQSIDDTANCSLLDEQKLKCQRNSEMWGTGSVVADSVAEVLTDIKEKSALYNGNEKPQILVTGSLHLVGAVLTILDPDLTMSTKF